MLFPAHIRSLSVCHCPSKAVWLSRHSAIRWKSGNHINKRFIPPKYITISGIHSSSTVLSAESTPSPDQDPSLEWERSGKEFLNGPDQILPSSAISTWHAQGAVRFSKLGIEPGLSRPPISIPSLFLQKTEKNPNFPAYAVKRNGKWEKTSNQQFYDYCWTVAKAFIALGMDRFSAVGLLGFNSPEWFISDVGAIMGGGIPTGIYTTSSPASCAYILDNCKASICVVEDEEQLAKILEHRHRLKHLKAIVQWSGTPKAEGVLSWKQLMELGAQQSDDHLKRRLKKMAVNQCCTLIYTSGTTGYPKGVMLSHDNMSWFIHEICYACGILDKRTNENESMVSYLPLSHIAGQGVDIFVPMYTPTTIYFADPDALKGTLINTMREVQPTMFMGVPRVWEKMYEAMREIGAQNKGLKLKIANWAKAQGTEYNLRKLAGDKNAATWQFKLADKLILSKVRHALGLARCHTACTGSAPISVEVLEYFRSLNFVLAEIYGLSESVGPHTFNRPWDNVVRFGSVGVTTGHVIMKVEGQSEDGIGELVLGGRNIFMGYLNSEKATRESVDQDGWLYSGDLGRIDKDGFTYVTGRLKEILITAGGENVAPVPIEENIKAALPCLSNVMVIGDKLKYLSALLTLKTEMNPDTNEPLDTLTKSSKTWLEKQGSCRVNTVNDVLHELYERNNSKLLEALNEGMKQANRKSVSRASQVKKWVILPKDFSMPGGELGPTLKLKRATTVEKYKDLIQQLYKEE